MRKKKILTFLSVTVIVFGCALSNIWAGTMERSKKDADRYNTAEAVYCGPYGGGWCVPTETPEP